MWHQETHSTNFSTPEKLNKHINALLYAGNELMSLKNDKNKNINNFANAAASTQNVNEYRERLGNRSLLSSTYSASMPENWQFANLTSTQMPSPLVLPHITSTSPPAAHVMTELSYSTELRRTLSTAAAAAAAAAAMASSSASARTTATSELADFLLSISKLLLPYIPVGVSDYNHTSTSTTTATKSTLSSLSSSSSMSTSPSTTANLAAAVTTAFSTYGLTDYLSIDLLNDIFLRLNNLYLHNDNFYSYHYQNGYLSNNYRIFPNHTTTQSTTFYPSTPLTTLPQYLCTPTIPQPPQQRSSSSSAHIYTPLITALSTTKSNKLHLPMPHVANVQQHQHQQQRQYHQNYQHHHYRYGHLSSDGKTLHRHSSPPLFEQIVDTKVSRTSQELMPSSRETAEPFERSKCCRKSKAAVDETDVDLLPPPKKKWIRHYLKGT